MTMLFFLKPHYGDTHDSGLPHGFDENLYREALKKIKTGPEASLIDTRLRDFIRSAQEQGFDLELDDLLLLFMMTER